MINNCSASFSTSFHLQLSEIRWPMSVFSNTILFFPWFYYEFFWKFFPSFFLSSLVFFFFSSFQCLLLFSIFFIHKFVTCLFCLHKKINIFQSAATFPKNGALQTCCHSTAISRWTPFFRSISSDIYTPCCFNGVEWLSFCPSCKRKKNSIQRDFCQELPLCRTASYVDVSLNTSVITTSS